jgi:preprotein translocase subunit SecD
MKYFFLFSLAFCILFLESIPTYGQNSAAREKAVQLEDLCRPLNGKKARPPKMRGLYFGRALFGPSDIASAEVDADQYTDEPVVMLTFSRQATKRLGNLTAINAGKTLPIFLDGTLLSCPIVNEPIFGGQIQIGGNLSATEAAQLASRIRRYAR